MRRVLIGVTGASGQLYAKKIIEKLRTRVDIELEVIFTETAIKVYKDELKEALPEGITLLNNNDYFNRNASGSNAADTLIIIPCTMNTIARIASGITGDLIARAAEVQLKERRRLIIVPRESPYNKIHLQNMLTLAESGAIIAPASPAFYGEIDNIDTLAEIFVSRIIALSSESEEIPKKERYNP